MIFHPLYRGGPAGRFLFFGIWGHYIADMHVKFQVDWSNGLGFTSAKNRVFPIDFDRRPYNSVTHYTTL